VGSNLNVVEVMNFNGGKVGSLKKVQLAQFEILYANKIGKFWLELLGFFLTLFPN